MAAVSIRDHLNVAFRLAMRDASAVKEVHNTQAAFWFSFQAAVISLPFLLVTVFFGADRDIGLLELIAEATIYAVSWLLFPVVMLEIAPAIDRAQYFYRYIAASNWSSVVEDAALAAILMLRTVGVIPAGLGGVLFFGAVIWVFSYQFFVARHALQIDQGTAALIIGVRLLLVLGLFFAKSLLGG